MKKTVRIFAPATVTNVGCGFDTFGFALEAPGDEIILHTSEKAGVHIKSISGDKGKLPYETNANTAGRALMSMLAELDISQGFDLEIHKKMALGTGMGSSAASAVGAVFALNELLSLGLDKHQLLAYAIEGEKLTSAGKVHADNVAASLFGGFISVRGLSPLDILSIPYPEDICVSVIHPHIELKTKEMRYILPETIPLKTAVKQWSNVAGFIAGLMQKDYNLMGRSMEDFVAEPLRASFIPGYEKAVHKARETGAIGSGISGSGPSMFSLCPTMDIATNVVREQKKLYSALGIDSDEFVSKINPIGPVVL